MHVINSADRISEFQLAMYCKLIQIMPEVLCSINSVLVGFGFVGGCEIPFSSLIK